MNTDVKFVLKAQAQLGEGPIWDTKAQVLYWVDILGSALHQYNPATGKDKVFDCPWGLYCDSMLLVSSC